MGDAQTCGMGMSDPTIIPNSIRRYLRRYVMRRRRIALMRRLGIAAAFSMLWMLGCAVIDRIVPMPGALRAVLFTIDVLAVVTLLLRPLVAIFRRQFDWQAAAAQVERRDPRFSGQLETVVSQLLLPAQIRASSPMVSRIAGEAGALAAQGKSSRLIALAPALRPWLLAIAIALLGAGLWRNSWLELPTLLRRELMPLARINAVTTARISVEPGDVDLNQGESCTVVARTQHLGSPPMIRLSNDGREFTSHAMSALGADQFSFTLQQVDRDWQYDVSGGDARSETYTIRVLRRPGVSQVRVQYSYPQYMHRDPATFVRDDGRIEAPVGTQAILSIVCTEPLAAAAVVFDGRRIPLRQTSDPNILQASLTITKSGPYELQLTSTRGVKGVPPRETVIEAIPDLPPQVVLRDSVLQASVDPMDRINLRARASDDHGIVDGNVNLAINGKTAQSYRMKPTDPLQATLNLADWSVAIGDVVRVWFEARDAIGQIGRSDSVTLVVSPTGIDVDRLACAGQLDAASKLSVSLSDEWNEALRSDAAPTRGSGSFGRNTHVARCEALADQLSGVLMRAIARNQNRELTTTLLEMVDRVAICQAGAHEAMASDDSVDVEQRKSTMLRAQRLARIMEKELSAVAMGEQARCARADLVNLQALVVLSDSTDPAHAAILRAALEAFGRSLDDRITSLGIQPDDEHVMDLLQDKASAADEWINWAQAIDWKKLAMETRTPELSQRLLLASRAEALRPDADFAQARDLNLAAYASGNWSTKALRSFLNSLTALQDPRRSLRMRAGQNPELDAFEAAARQRPINVRGVQLSQLPAIISTITEKSDPSMISPSGVDERIDRLNRMRPFLSLAGQGRWVDWLEDGLIERSPLSAARELARHSEPAEQQAAIRACEIAARDAARYQARVMIESSPAIAQILSDSRSSMSKGDESAPVPPAPATTEPSGSIVSSDTFDDALRIYFQLLRKAQ
jgi:hypothetical protein